MDRHHWETIEELHSYLGDHLIHTKDIRFLILDEALTANYDLLGLEDVQHNVHRLACRFSETNQFVCVAAMAVTVLYSQLFCPLFEPPISWISEITFTLQDFELFDKDTVLLIFQFGDYILEYPKLAYLNVKFDEFSGIMTRLTELLKVAEYRVFWKDPDPPLYVKTLDKKVKEASTELRSKIREELTSALGDCLKKQLIDEIRDCIEEQVKGQLLKALRQDLKDELNDLWNDQQALVMELFEEVKQDVKRAAAKQETHGEGDKKK